MNARYELLMQNYLQHDQMTLLLAAVALAVVLVGWSLMRPRTKAYRILRDLYLGFVLLAHTLILAGTMYVFVFGGVA